MVKHDCVLKEDPVCPCCGGEYYCVGLPDDGGELQCGGCGFEFTYQRLVEYTYTTRCKVHDWPEWKEDTVAVWCKRCGKRAVNREDVR